METHNSQEIRLDKDGNKVEKHPKQDFQVERLAFFSDAVFAIAITLLVVEFKIPRITGDTTYNDALQQLWDLKYLFAATLFSFLFIASYWINHHLLFKYIHNYNNKLTYINMLVLLPIIFFPFTTAFFAESLNSSLMENGKFQNIFLLGFRLFMINNFFAALTCYILYWYAMVKHKELSFTMPTKEKMKFRTNILFVVFTFFIAIILSFLNLSFINNMFIIDFVLWGGIIILVIIKRKQKKRLAEEEKLKCIEKRE